MNSITIKFTTYFDFVAGVCLVWMVFSGALRKEFLSVLGRKVNSSKFWAEYMAVAASIGACGLVGQSVRSISAQLGKPLLDTEFAIWVAKDVSMVMFIFGAFFIWTFREKGE